MAKTELKQIVAENGLTWISANTHRKPTTFDLTHEVVRITANTMAKIQQKYGVHSWNITACAFIQKLLSDNEQLEIPIEQFKAKLSLLESHEQPTTQTPKENKASYDELILKHFENQFAHDTTMLSDQSKHKETLKMVNKYIKANVPQQHQNQVAQAFKNAYSEQLFKISVDAPTVEQTPKETQQTALNVAVADTTNDTNKKE